MVIRLALLLLLLSFSTFSTAAQLTASVDHDELLENEHLLLTISLINSDTRLRAEGINPNIDLSLLSKDFELGVPKAENRFNVYRNKGRSTSSILVTLFPKRSGKLFIPIFNVEGLSTKIIPITVHNSPASKTPQVFYRSGVLKNQLWVGEQTLAYLDLYSRVEIKNAQLGGNLEASIAQMEITPLAKSEQKKKHNGVEYDVTRMSWRIAPLQDQALTINFPDIWVETISGERIRLPFSQTDIKVQALPDTAPAYAIIGTPKIEQNPLPDTINSGELFLWDITLRIPALASSLPEQLPELSFPPQLKVFTDAVTRSSEIHDGIYTGIANYRFYITPLTNGQFVLPAINIPYFNIKQGIMDLVSLPAQTIDVNSAPFRQAVDSNKKITQHSNEDTEIFNTLISWKNAAISFILLWLATAVTWWLSRQKIENSGPSKNIKQENFNLNTTYKDQLLQAMETNTLEQGLRQYQNQAGNDEEVYEIIRLVQRQCYGEKPSHDDLKLQDNIINACLKIQAQTNTPKNTDDPWQAESFTRKLPNIEDH